MRRSPLILISLAATAALALSVAGCGGGSPSVADITTSTTTTASTPQNGAVAFAVCMRSHGLPSWPDPEANGAFDKQKLVQLHYGKAQVRAAERPCGHLLPPVSGSAQSTQETATKVADGLSFAKCMRSRGVPRFPDPTAQGELSVAMVQAQGVDVHSPAVLAVVQRCLPASHGALTAAKVREALNSAGG
ncbi:MAG TPA: hypothetical protein VGG41_20825 [Solirubrobacteraceae bacterium]|jgi:hypothetical protein